MELDPIFTIAIVGKCKLSTMQKVKDFFDTLEGFDTVYLRTTKGKLWIKEGDDD